MPEHFFVYPAYLARESSRALGRRVPADVAAKEVTIEEIVRAATSLGFTAVAEPDKQYPRQFYTYSGRVKVTKKAGTSKTAFLHRLAAELKRQSSEGSA